MYGQSKCKLVQLERSMQTVLGSLHVLQNPSFEFTQRTMDPDLLHRHVWRCSYPVAACTAVGCHVLAVLAQRHSRYALKHMVRSCNLLKHDGLDCSDRPKYGAVSTGGYHKGRCIVF